MDRYVLVVVVNLEAKKEGTFNGIGAVKKIHDSLKDISSTNSTSRISSLPACSLSGSPASQKWYFAIQVTQGPAQLCSSEWEEVYVQCSDSEESVPSEVENYVSALQQQEEQVLPADIVSHVELFEEAAEALHQLADKLPPPGRFLLDVILLCEDVVMVKDFLPVIGSLKHMQAWHSAQMTVVTEHNTGWQAAASYLSGRVCSPSLVESCIDVTELWRGGLLIREKKFASELLFEGYSLKRQNQSCLSQMFYPHSNPCSITDHMTQHEVFHYYQQVLELIQLVRVTDLPVILHCSTEFELALSSRSAKAKLLLDQLGALRGGVGALFSLSCVVSSEALPPVSQLSASKWRDFVAECPKVLSAPDVEVKGEKGHYLLLVQGSDTGRCRARLINSANQINGSVPLATVQSRIRENIPSSSGTDTADWLRSLPRLCGDNLMRTEKRLARVQLGAVQECARRREEAQKPAAVPLNNVKLLLRLARERYLNMCNATLPKASPCVPATKQKHVSVTGANIANSQWPERSVLRNYENMQKIRHRNRSRLLSSGSSECLMGPKDAQKRGSAPLDARELLKHFTPDGLPSGELQPLPVLRGENAFQLSSDLTPRKVTKLPFRQAANSHYHGIEFCLDERNALERDRGFASLQSRLIRFETQTTCCKEPCPVPLALSPLPTSTPTPSPSEPGSVPDGETAHSEPPLLKRHSREPEALSHQHKRLAKSESSESLGSQCNGGSSKHPKVRALQQQAGRSLSSSGSNRHSAAGAETSHEPSPSQKPSQCPTESRSQKHNRMLKEVVAKTLKHYGITSEHECFKTCSQRLFDVSKLYLKDLKTSRGLHEEMKKAAGRNAKQVIDWVVEKASKK